MMDESEMLAAMELEDMKGGSEFMEDAQTDVVVLDLSVLGKPSPLTRNAAGQRI
jgi:hypothetical protein